MLSTDYQESVYSILYEQSWDIPGQDSPLSYMDYRLNGLHVQYSTVQTCKEHSICYDQNSLDITLWIFNSDKKIENQRTVHIITQHISYRDVHLPFHLYLSLHGQSHVGPYSLSVVTPLCLNLFLGKESQVFKSHLLLGPSLYRLNGGCHSKRSIVL